LHRRTQSPLVLALVVLAAACAPAPVAAFEIFGVRLFGGERGPPPPPDAISYTAELILTADDGRLERNLSRGSRVLAGVDGPPAGPAALLASARGDYQRLLAVLYAAGRYGGSISITVDGREAADIPVDAAIPDGAAVTITVDPGPTYLFGSVRIVNRPGPIADDRKVPPTPEALGLAPGRDAKSTTVLAAEDALVGRWREKGYPKAAIARRTATARHREEELDVAVTVEPGRRAVFGETGVTGTDRMDPRFVAYYADIPEGERFDPDDLERARDQLRRLEVFQAVRIVEADAVRDDGTLPITLNVAERRRRVFGGGARFSSVDGLGLEGYWRHRNLFGRAEKLGIEGRVGGINGDDPDEYNYRIGANFLKPGVFTPMTDLAAQIYGEQLAPDEFRARTIAGNLGFRHRFTPRLSGEAFASFEASTIDRTETGDGEFLLASLPAALNYDGSDDPLDPTEGVRLGAKAEPFFEFENNNPGVITELEARAYLGLADDRLVLAARAMAGGILGPPRDEVPANRLYFAGGGGSIRGYPYREVGPTNAAGDVEGGRSVFTASLEARVRVTERIGLVPFVDAGNAFTSQLPDFSEPLVFGVGAGVRYRTGLGPIRLDVAVPLDRFDGDPPIAVYIGLGQAF